MCFPRLITPRLAIAIDDKQGGRRIMRSPSLEVGCKTAGARRGPRNQLVEQNEVEVTSRNEY